MEFGPGNAQPDASHKAGRSRRASATHTATAEARFARFDFSRALNQSCFLNKAREELALGEIPGSQRSRSSPGDQTADKSEQTVHPQPCGADPASLPACPASLALPPHLLLSQARCCSLLLQLQPLSTLQPADGKNPCVPQRMPRRCAEYLPNGVLKIDIIHGSCDARTAGVSLGWKGKTNLISNLQKRAEGARGTRAALPQAGDTSDTQPTSLSLLMPIAVFAGTRVGFGVSPPTAAWVCRCLKVCWRVCWCFPSLHESAAVGMHQQLIPSPHTQQIFQSHSAGGNFPLGLQEPQSAKLLWEPHPNAELHPFPCHNLPVLG